MDSLFLSLKFVVFRNGRRLAPPISKRYQPPQLPILSGYINNLFWDHPSIGNIFGNILYTEKEPGTITCDKLFSFMVGPLGFEPRTNRL